MRASMVAALCISSLVLGIGLASAAKPPFTPGVDDDTPLAGTSCSSTSCRQQPYKIDSMVSDPIDVGPCNREVHPKSRMVARGRGVPLNVDSPETAGIYKDTSSRGGSEITIVFSRCTQRSKAHDSIVTQIVHIPLPQNADLNGVTVDTSRSSLRRKSVR